MIETLMKQLYFRGLRRRVEHLVAQRRETAPAEVYLYWIDGGDQSWKVEARHQPDHDETSTSAGEGFPASMENLWERGRRSPGEPVRCTTPRLAPRLRSAGPHLS